MTTQAPQPGSSPAYTVVPKIGELTNSLLFGDIWERPQLSKRDRSMITVAVLTAMYRTDQLRGHIRRAVESLSRTLGQRPLGWYCRTGPSVNTRRLLIEEGGFLYDSDSYADELPYWVKVADKPHLVVPYSLTTNDGLFTRGGIGTAEQWTAFLKGSFDMLYAEGADRPRMMSVGLHMRLVGHPGRAVALARFLDYAMGFDKVWFARRIDIARHWTLHHPWRG